MEGLANANVRARAGLSQKTGGRCRRNAGLGQQRGQDSPATRGQVKSGKACRPRPRVVATCALETAGLAWGVAYSRQKTTLWNKGTREPTCGGGQKQRCPPREFPLYVLPRFVVRIQSQGAPAGGSLRPFPSGAKRTPRLAEDASHGPKDHHGMHIMDPV